MQKYHFLLLKNFKNTESAQLWTIWTAMQNCQTQMIVMMAPVEELKAGRRMSAISTALSLDRNNLDTWSEGGAWNFVFFYSTHGKVLLLPGLYCIFLYYIYTLYTVFLVHLEWNWKSNHVNAQVKMSMAKWTICIRVLLWNKVVKKKTLLLYNLVRGHFFSRLKNDWCWLGANWSGFSNPWCNM